MSTPKKKSAAAKHPAYFDLIKEAIKATAKPIKGSSRQAIEAYLTAKYGAQLPNLRSHLRVSLRRLVESKKLTQTKGSYRVGPAGKEVAKKKKKAAKKTPKKSSTKKKAAGTKRKAKKSAKKAAKKAKKPKKSSTKKAKGSSKKKAGSARKAKAARASKASSS
eukprot:TRINITY_DN13138_c0_g1_i1.p1 TRINITY_DN13138_c0_g1~~TRINITY_DN13138_c0_g1_i1.p1  ORF type:complete len:191 (+),score=43.86 TRINITY_DN13138_c0_g1_i1:85-573(+)